MATNSQVFPQSTWPLTGDLASSPGNPNITVDGIQNVPVLAGLPLDQQTLVYQAALSEYVPTYTPFNRSLLVNNVGVSDEYWVFVKRIDTEVQVNSSIAPNSFPVQANGSAVNTF
jgi:hypothetical protein